MVHEQEMVKAADWRQRVTRAAAELFIRRPFPGSSRLLRNGYRFFGSPSNGPMLASTRDGFVMQIDPVRNGILDASIYFNGTYEAGTIHVIQRTLRPADVFVDVGANIGLMTLVAARSVGAHGEIHAFEPMPDVCAILRRNVLLNHLDNVHVQEKALGSTSERRTIYTRPWVNRGGAASLVRPERTDTEKHEVQVVRLDEFVKRRDLRAIRMIKADIEGWELEMLRGAGKLLAGALAPALCIEYSVRGPSAHDGPMDVFDFVRSVNAYQVFKLRHGKETISRLVPIVKPSDLPRHDNIFCFLPDQIRDIGSRLF
jgi:FkbM family methyltransferase